MCSDRSLALLFDMEISSASLIKSPLTAQEGAGREGVLGVSAEA